MKYNMLFLDLETTKDGKIKDIGALFGSKELPPNKIEILKSWIDKSQIICGHNILEHDIPILKEKLGDDLFDGKKYIDTLLWSPLLFAKKPYHRLVKGYKLINEKEYSNPLSDCKLTKQLLNEELEAFDKLTDQVKLAFNYLLRNDNNYLPFLDLCNIPNKAITFSNITELFSGSICSSVNTKAIVDDDPIAFAYALAIVLTNDNYSICSSWVLHKIPRAQELLEELRFNNCGKSECTFCENNLNPKKALFNYFGYQNFRKFDYDEKVSLQERTVIAGIQNQSFVAVFPTGGGKSLTFQLPALMKGDLARQLTVVISPLVSLMKDQVDVLESRFHVQSAVYISGLLSPLERKEAFERVQDGTAYILYIAPESLRSPSIYRLLRQRSIARFVIDEAHCFSSWGQDFRVDYLYIGEFIKSLNTENSSRSTIPVSCFTATAKPQVIEDIKTYFNERLDLELIEYVTRAERKNLKYEVIDVENKERKDEILLDLLKKVEKPVIIYASRTKKVEELASIITSSGISCTCFHGKLDKDIKKSNQDLFMSGGCEVIVATSAFGMGVDKDDVRTVIHYDISDSLENYIQEAGRAGRKEAIQAKCYILYFENDLNKHFSLLQQTKINQKEIQQIWLTLKNLTKYRSKISKSALEIAKNAGWDTEIRELENKVTASISALEDQGFLRRELNSPQVFADSLLIRNLDSGLNMLKRSSSITDDQRKDSSRILQVIIKEDQVRLDYLADRLDMSLKQVQDTITILRDLKILGDAQDLTAFLNLGNSSNSSENVLLKFKPIESKLLEIFASNTLTTSIRALNQRIEDSGIENCSTDIIYKILDYWKRRNFIERERVDRQDNKYRINIKDKSKLAYDIERRHDIASGCFRELEEKYKSQKRKVQRKADIPVLFSLLELKEKASRFISSKTPVIKEFEQALLYLNDIKAISLEGGFMVIYNRLNISNIDRSKQKFTLSDYSKMKKHYEHKVQQIHVVGEYAKKRMHNYKEALDYVNDYFTLSFSDFMQKHFQRRGVELSRAMTATKFTELFGVLDTDQLEVVNSKKDYSLVLAGPGSGKTKVLVHKIASLLLLEDIKPEQFLMLTFSKAAALEFRSRVFALIPEYGRLIKIATFHGYCFELLGQLGDLVKSQQVIQKCTEAISNEDIDISSIANKSVLLLDEFQDISAEEWELVKVIIKKAGNIRVIAVGDDDQCIYEFRGAEGASITIMKEYRDRYSATEYGLLKNYRSRKGIIEFNNQILNSISERMKSGSVLIPPKKTLKAKISYVNYSSRYLTKPLVDDLVKQTNQGSTAILARWNKHVLLASSLLKEKNIRPRMFAGYDDFRIFDLLEIREYHNLIKSRVMESGLILGSSWNEAKDIFNEKYSASKHFQSCKSVIEYFEKQYGSTYEYVDWKDYITQIKAENTFFTDNEYIVVSTMHKAKGKEYDNVYLLLEDLDTYRDEEKRLIYTACSRAKNKLVIHANNQFLNSIQQDELKSSEYTKETSPPKSFDLLLTHKDVQLGSFQYNRSIRIIDKLSTGDPLILDSINFGEAKAPGLAKENEGNLLLFSNAFVNGNLRRAQNEGYSIKNACAEYIVYWYDQNKDEEFKIVLPRITFSLEK